MRHKNSGRRLGRNSPHRRAMYRNLAASLLVHETVRTTLPKAKELRRVVEPLITLAKEDSVSHRRLAFDRLRDDKAVGRPVQGARPALQGSPGRLPADPQDRLPRRRLGADGDRPAARSAREGRRARRAAHDGVSRAFSQRQSSEGPRAVWSGGLSVPAPAVVGYCARVVVSSKRYACGIPLRVAAKTKTGEKIRALPQSNPPDARVRANNRGQRHPRPRGHAARLCAALEGAASLYEVARSARATHGRRRGCARSAAPSARSARLCARADPWQCVGPVPARLRRRRRSTQSDARRVLRSRSTLARQRSWRIAIICWPPRARFALRSCWISQTMPAA